jgi:drug/metabolite transporter (DMT)-like permease
MDKKPVTVGVKEGIGAGIAGLGVLLMVMPSFAQKISDALGNSSEPYAILTGAVLVFGFLTILAGVAVIATKMSETDEEE